jgi:hypothetical protein
MNSEAIAVLENELTALKAAQADLLASIETAKVRLSEIEIQRRVIVKLKDQIAATNGIVKKSKSGQPSATEAVVAYLKDHPGSLPVEIVEAVLSLGIKTSSDKPKRLLYNTVYQLEKKGAIEKRPDGKGLVLTEKGKGGSQIS